MLLRERQPPMAFHGVGIGLFARHAHQMRDHFRRLPHIEVRCRISETPLQSNDWIEVRRANFQERCKLRQGLLCGSELREPPHTGLRKHQRRVAQRFRATRQNQIGLTGLYVAIGRIERLHAGATIDLHRERHHAFAHAEPQRRDTRRIHLVRDHVHAAENDLIERVWFKGLPRQQRPAALHGEINRGEGPGATLCFQERRPRAVDNINRTCHQLAARSGVVCLCSGRFL